MINLIPFKQFISAGHHDNDPGAVANGYQENELTKDLRNRILKYGNSKEIIVDRDSETNREYQNRIKPGAGSVVLDIHFDAGPSRVTGVTAFVNEKDLQNKDSLSYKCGVILTDFISRVLGSPDRGVKSERVSQHKKLGILNLGAGCSVLIEIEFITNAQAMANYDSKKEILAKGIAEIAQRFDDLVK